MWRDQLPLDDVREEARETVAYARSVCRALTLIHLRTGEIRREAQAMTALARALKPLSACGGFGSVRIVTSK
jgi:hypothetical protein